MVKATSGSFGEKEINEQSASVEVAAPVPASQHWTLPFNAKPVLFMATAPARVVPSDEKERESWHEPLDQLRFVSTNVYLKTMLKEQGGLKDAEPH